MKKSSHKILATILLMSSFIIGGCGDDGSTNSVTCDSQSLELLIGSYNLSSFEITYDNGNVVTEQDYYTYSGSMEIGADCTLSQTITLNGETSTGTRTISAISDHSLEIFSPACIYTLSYSLNNNNLTTTLHQGTCDFGYSEIDVWEKTSPQPASIKTMSDNIEDDYEINEAIVGGVAGSIE